MSRQKHSKHFHQQRSAMPAAYLGTRRTGSKYYYQFEIDCTCGYLAEVGIPNHKNTSLIECPDCHALYAFHKPVGMFAQPTLVNIFAKTARA